jgi:hypothetical protein
MKPKLYCKVEDYISPGRDQIPADLIQAGGKNIAVWDPQTH